MAASSTTLAEDDCTMSSDTLELYFAVVDATMTKDLYVATRTSKSVDFGPAVAVNFNAASLTDETPRLSADNLTLYYGSARAGGVGGEDIWFVQRPPGGNWGPPQNLTEVNSTTVDKWFMPCSAPGSKDYLLVSNRGALTYTTLFEGKLGGGAPTKVAELDAGVSQTGTFLTPDCLTLFFAMNNDIYKSTRTAIGQPWKPATVVTDFSTPTFSEQDPWQSPDERTFIFASNAAGTNDIYMSTR